MTVKEDQCPLKNVLSTIQNIFSYTTTCANLPQSDICVKYSFHSSDLPSSYGDSYPCDFIAFIHQLQQIWYWYEQTTREYKHDWKAASYLQMYWDLVTTSPSLHAMCPLNFQNGILLEICKPHVCPWIASLYSWLYFSLNTMRNTGSGSRVCWYWNNEVKSIFSLLLLLLE